MPIFSKRKTTPKVAKKKLITDKKSDRLKLISPITLSLPIIGAILYLIITTRFHHNALEMSNLPLASGYDTFSEVVCPLIPSAITKTLRFTLRRVGVLIVLICILVLRQSNHNRRFLA